MEMNMEQKVSAIKTLIDNLELSLMDRIPEILDIDVVQKEIHVGNIQEFTDIPSIEARNSVHYPITAFTSINGWKIYSLHRL